jgi:disulfide bond formation protein DsbB
MQYGFGVMPCELCLWQRAPFVAVAALSFVALLVPKYARALLGVCALALLANAGLASFHSGVERHWWEFHSACTGSALDRVKSVEDLRQELLGTPVVRCDEISWSIFGLTMANINVVYSAVLAMVAVMAAKK